MVEDVLLINLNFLGAAFGAMNKVFSSNKISNTWPSTNNSILIMSLLMLAIKFIQKPTKGTL